MLRLGLITFCLKRKSVETAYNEIIRECEITYRLKKFFQNSVKTVNTLKIRKINMITWI